MSRLNEKVYTAVRRRSPSKRETEAQTDGGRQQAELQPATTGKNSKQKEGSGRVCMHVTRSRTHKRPG